MEMIRQRLLRLTVLLLAAVTLPGCVSIESGGGRVIYWVVPGMEGGDRSNSAGTTYYNERWARSPDTHPAVAGTPPPPSPPSAAGEPVENGSGSRSPGYPPYSTRWSSEKRADGQTAGAVLGALVGAQAGNRVAGVAVGSAVGALAGGKLADPCQPDANAGSLWGALAGGFLGSLFGGGRGRDAFIALGASGGAVRGTEMWGDRRSCR